MLLGSEKYANLNNAQLCPEVAHRDMEMIELTDRLRKGLKRARYWEDKCSDGQEALEQKGKMTGHLRSILNLREERKNVTKNGGYAMAIKRNLSHSGAAAMVATLCGEEERGGLKSKDALQEPVPTIHQLPLLLRSTTRLRRIGCVLRSPTSKFMC